MWVFTWKYVLIDDCTLHIVMCACGLPYNINTHVDIELLYNIIVLEFINLHVK